MKLIKSLISHETALELITQLKQSLQPAAVEVVSDLEISHISGKSSAEKKSRGIPH